MTSSVAGLNLDNRSKHTLSRPKIFFLQIVAVVVFLVLWEYVPAIPWFSVHYHFTNRFFVSSPSGVYQQLVDLLTGSNGEVAVWPYLRNTLLATVTGTSIGLILGAGSGLICSSSVSLARFARPFVVIANSMPRVALLPIIVIIVGPTVRSSAVGCIMIVYFLGFFNAFAGGTSVSPNVVDNARLLGASRIAIMRHIRWPSVMIWTFAGLPNAISFGLVAVVTTELLTGVTGMGSLILVATTELRSSELLAVVFLLSVFGLILYGGGELLKRRVLRWNASDNEG